MFFSPKRSHEQLGVEELEVLRSGLFFLQHLDRVWRWIDSESDEALLTMYATTPEQKLSVLNALTKLGQPKIAYWLKMLHGLYFRQEIESLDFDLAVERGAARSRLVWRLLTNMAMESEKVIHEMSKLAKNANRAIQAERKQLETSVAMRRREISRQRGEGGPSVLLLRGGDGFVRVLEQWLAERGLGYFFSPSGAVKVHSWDDVARLQGGKNWHAQLHESQSIGIRRNPESAFNCNLSHWIKDSEAYLTELSQHFEWVIVPSLQGEWELGLMFVSTDQDVFQRFIACVYGCSGELVSVYEDVHQVETVFKSAIFYECCAYGQAALVAAEQDGCLPLILVRIDEQIPFFWWDLLSRSSCVGMARKNIQGAATLIAAFRVNDEETYLEFWKNLDHDSNIAIAAVSGNVHAENAINAYEEDHRIALSALSKSSGWAYMHFWGGGSGENVAIFRAQNPTTTARVHQFAKLMKSKGWGSGALF